MLTTYRHAFRVPGSVRFSATGLIARMPMSMVTLGIVLLVSEVTGSYAAAGILSAAYQLPAALGAIASSRLADRLGQARLLPWLVCANGVFLVLFVVAVERGAPFALQMVLVAVAGVAQPSIGAMVRARWAAAAPDAATKRGAFAVESVVDEVIFSIGPPLTALLAIQVALPLPLVLAAALGTFGGIALAVQRRTQPPVHPTRSDADGARRRAAIARAGMPALVTAALGVGAVFGSYEVSVVAFTAAQQVPAASGIVLGLWAVSSMIGGLWFGARQWRMPMSRQMMLLPAIVCVSLLPAPFVNDVIPLSVVTIISGFAVAPTLITLFHLTERLVPGPQMTEGLTWTASGLALGFAGGTAIAGFVVDGYGTRGGFLLPIAAAACALLAALVGQRAFRLTDGADAVPESPVADLPIVPLPDVLPGPAADGVIDSSR